MQLLTRISENRNVSGLVSISISRLVSSLAEMHTDVVLLQVEVDRFQDSLRLLRDYYTGMYKQVLSEAGPEFTCIPLLDIVALEEPGTQTDKSKRQAEGCCSGEGIRPDSFEIHWVYSLETILKQGGRDLSIFVQ